MTDIDGLDTLSEEAAEPSTQPPAPQAPTRPTPVRPALALLSDTGATHPYISKAGWLDLLRHIATIGKDGVLTAPVDFLAVQLALYSGFAVSTELAVSRRSEKNRRNAEKIPLAAEQNNALLTAARAFNTAATCMSEVGPRMVDIAQAAADACGAKTEQKPSPTRNRAKVSAVPDREMAQTGGKRLPGKSPSSPLHN